MGRSDGSKHTGSAYAQGNLAHGRAYAHSVCNYKKARDAHMRIALPISKNTHCAYALPGWITREMLHMETNFPPRKWHSAYVAPA